VTNVYFFVPVTTFPPPQCGITPLIRILTPERAARSTSKLMPLRGLRAESATLMSGGGVSLLRDPLACELLAQLLRLPDALVALQPEPVRAVVIRVYHLY